MKIDCAIFDLDGTLVDSMLYWAKVPQTYLEKKGIIEKEDIATEFLSMSLEESAIFLKEKYQLQDSVKEIMQGINDCIEDYYLNNIPLKPGIKELLDELKTRNVKMAVATATDKYLVIECLHKLNIESYFDYVITSSEVGSSKNNPEIYLRCAAYLKSTPEKSIIFEDLPYGIISSHQVGFHTVGLYDEASKHLQKQIKDHSDFYFLSIDEKAKKTLLEFIA
ncbi:MAG: HAD family phosphatase [Bacillales bacterium]|nr:HAD family phosphatase [Bacillales bacterium]